MRLARGFAVLMVLAAAAPALAQPGPQYRAVRNVAGIWQWRAAGGRFGGRLILVQDGATVKGAIVESNGPALGDLDGVVDGRRLSFRRSANVGRVARTWDYTVWLHEGGAEMQGRFVDAQDARGGGDFSAVRLFPAAPVTTGPVVVAPPPPAPPPPPVNPGPLPPRLRPMEEGALAQLVAAIDGESFSENKLGLLTQAAGYNYFRVDQAARLLPLFTYEETRLQALEQLRPRLTDPQNGFKLVSLFTYSESKTRAQQILQR